MATSDSEGAIDKSWAKEPLCCEEPSCGHEGVAGEALEVVRLFACRGRIGGEL